MRVRVRTALSFFEQDHTDNTNVNVADAGFRSNGDGGRDAFIHEGVACGIVSFDKPACDRARASLPMRLRLVRRHPGMWEAETVAEGHGVVVVRRTIKVGHRDPMLPETRN